MDWSALPRHVWLHVALHLSKQGGGIALCRLQSTNRALRALLSSDNNNSSSVVQQLWQTAFAVRHAHHRALLLLDAHSALSDAAVQWRTLYVVAHTQLRARVTKLRSEADEIDRQTEQRKQELDKLRDMLLQKQRELQEAEAAVADVQHRVTSEERAVKTTTDDAEEDDVVERQPKEQQQHHHHHQQQQQQSILDKRAKLQGLELKVHDIQQRVEEARSRSMQKRDQLMRTADEEQRRLREDDTALSAPPAEDAAANWEALALAVTRAPEGSVVVVMPGLYDKLERKKSRSLAVTKAIHIVGCCFNRDFTPNLTARHAVQLPEPSEPPNIIIRNHWDDAISWRVAGGSVRNVALEFRDFGQGEEYYFGLFVAQSAVLQLRNVSVCSRNHISCMVQVRAVLNAVNCRFHGSPQSGLAFLAGAAGSLSECTFDHNTSSGLEVQGANVNVSRCVFYSNRCSGLGTSGPTATIAVDGCSVFENGMHGVEITRELAANAWSVRNCHISGNMNGITVWKCDASEEEVRCLQKQLMEECSNDVTGNRVTDVRVRLSPANESLVDIALKEEVCTFLYTGAHFYEQEQWSCNTCGLSGAMSICRVCALTCHKGHDVELAVACGDCYCDDVLLYPKCCFTQEYKDKAKQ